MRDIAFGVATGYFIVITVTGIAYIICQLLDALQKYLKSRNEPVLKKFLVYDGDDHSFSVYRSSSAETLIDVLSPVFHKIDFWLIFEAVDEYNLDTWAFVASSDDIDPFLGGI